MMRSLSLLFFVAAAFIVGTFADPSIIPNCFTCPPQDQEGFPLGGSDQTMDPFFCSYPVAEDDFFCLYSSTTGVLVTDADDGLCQPIAVNNCWKRDALPRSPRSGQQARSPKPANMQTRYNLKKRRV